jgi:hypothetical protein
VALGVPAVPERRGAQGDMVKADRSVVPDMVRPAVPEPGRRAEARAGRSCTCRRVSTAAAWATLRLGLAEVSS